MLFIQDFSFSKSYSIHEALIKSCTKATQGYGAYAFASKNGVEVLFKDKEFDALLDRGTYSLIVGIDEITNLSSLEALCKLKDSKPNFNVKAFYHENKGSLFHPKLSFFRNEAGDGSLIVGSGNLTLGGLRNNREAFAVIDLSVDEFRRIEAYWSEWLNESADNLSDITDDKVIARAKENIILRRKTEIWRSKKRPPEESETQEIEAQEPEFTVLEGWQFTSESKVLLAEIPRSGDRWKQANFDINTFKDFFGATPGDNNQRILLRHLNDDSSLAQIEVRPSVSVASQNYRFELDAASDLPYPEDGKPIGVFIQLSTRMFLYHLYMPHHSLYKEIKDWMDTNWSGRQDRMKRIVTTPGTIDNIITNSIFQPYKI